MARGVGRAHSGKNFPESDATHAEELSVKATEGLISADEEAELETCVDVGDLLAVWESRARQRLRNIA